MIMILALSETRISGTTSLRALILGLALLISLANGLHAVPWDPAAADYTGREGAALYVSKLGDDSDGSSWEKAFHTIQRALSAVPDDKGGHCIVIRPDTYAEAMLDPAHKGAKGAYNLLVGDFDGRLGSGAKGWVVVDSGAPLVALRRGPSQFEIDPSGDPAKQTGLKCIDWYGPWRCEPGFSGVVWDRWIFRHIYGTGSEGGIGWDMSCQGGCEFSAVVEDCVGIGRFAGAAVMAHVGRKDEPVVFRRSYFMNLDWWGDAGGVYVRGANRSAPDYPDAIFDDCTIIGPDNALNVAWGGVDTNYTRVKFKNCRLIVLNFSQPHGTPSSGIIYCASKEGKQLHVDLEDCILAGFKVFGTRSGEISYTTKGKCKAYVQFQQPVPAGFERLRFFPTELFDQLAPPKIGTREIETP
jgi:hypothetical protein